MDRKELDMILKEGEGYKIEFKEGFNNLDKEIVAFANSSGGRIFLGVTDEGKIKGIGISNELKSRIQDIANNCRPKIKISIDIFEKIFIINVREGDDKPYECSAGFYKRIGSNSQKMTRDEIIDFFKSEGKIRFDELILPEFSYPRDFDENKVLKFLELAGLSKSVKTEIILINLGVKFFPDRIRIENYWQEPPNFILGETVFRRNHIIADLFARIHFGEKMGSGFERIREICKKENAPFPEIEYNENYFYVTFRQSNEYLKLAAGEEPKKTVEVALNERQRQAIEYVKSHKHITISEYISLNKVSDKTARRDLNYLVEKGLFVKEGSTTGLKFRLTSVNSGQLRSEKEEK